MIDFITSQWLELPPMAQAAYFLVSALTALMVTIGLSAYNEEMEVKLKLSGGTIALIALVWGLFWPIAIPRHLVSSAVKDGQKLGKLPKSVDDLQDKIRLWFHPTGDKTDDYFLRHKKLNRIIYGVSVFGWTFMVLLKISLAL